MTMKGEDLVLSIGSKFVLMEYRKLAPLAFVFPLRLKKRARALL